MTDSTAESTAEVPTDRPGRYAKQLVSHMSRRAEGTWDDAGVGKIIFSGARLDLRSQDGTLLLELTATPENIDQMEDVVGRHLVRFGSRDELVVAWRRADGVEGTIQRKTED